MVEEVGGREGTLTDVDACAALRTVQPAVLQHGHGLERVERGARLLLPCTDA